MTPEALLKENRIEIMTLVWSLSQTELMEGEVKESGLTHDEEVGLMRILSDFEGIFQDPQGLPLERRVDHKIPPKEGTEPIKVRP